MRLIALIKLSIADVRLISSTTGFRCLAKVPEALILFEEMHWQKQARSSKLNAK